MSLYGKILPSQGAVISQEFLNGLKVLWTAGMGSGITNLAPGGTNGSFVTSSISPDASRMGKALKCGVASDNGLVFQTTSNAATLTLMLSVQFYNTGATEGFFQWVATNSATNSGNVRLLLQNNSGTLRYYDGGSYAISESGVGTDGSVHNIVLRSTPSETYYYRNGRRTSTSAPSSFTGAYIYFGNGFSTNSRCYISIGAWWEADIGDAAAMRLSINPAHVFSSSKVSSRVLRAAYVAAGGGGGVGPLIGGRLVDGGRLMRGRLVG